MLPETAASITDASPCVGNQLVYRISFSLGCFFTLTALLSCAVARGCENFFDGYVDIACVASALFIILQIIIILDSTYSLRDYILDKSDEADRDDDAAWTRRNQDHVGGAYLALVFVCMALSIAGLRRGLGAGIARALRVFLEKDHPPVYTLEPRVEGPHHITVKPNTKLLRPYVVSAVLRDVHFAQERYDSFIDLQDKLHQNTARSWDARPGHDPGTLHLQRTYAAISVALLPNEIKLKPLSQDKEFEAKELLVFYRTNPDVKHIKPYTDIIYDSPVYPMITDKNGVRPAARKPRPVPQVRGHAHLVRAAAGAHGRQPASLGAGLDVEAAEVGDNLSGTSASCLKDSKVVVLDEATAIVDTARDALIQTTI
ncbi:hypothetical protein PR001_g27017 [Phytophthora rubi]|uniref:Uncharacterized protein n=1 Tax=Phytophthora rubi TaxID=129364 RepID=A0A6A3HN45_9STRA|nr:hypothetical protein PR001_g27017 [Phytophthora rubi]